MKLPLPRFGKKTPSRLGIDIDASAVRLVELVHTNTGYQLQGCVQVPLELEANTRPWDWQHPAVTAGLQQALQQRQGHTRQVAIALPQSAALFKTVELDRTLTAHEITAQVHQHAQQYFNYPLTDLMWDFEILATPARHAELQQVRWVAARRQEVQMRTEVLTKLGLDVVAVEVDAFSLQRLINAQCEESDGAVTVLHFNDEGVLLVVLGRLGRDFRPNKPKLDPANKLRDVERFVIGTRRLGRVFRPNKLKVDPANKLRDVEGLHYMRFEEYAPDDTDAVATSALRAWQTFQNSELVIAINAVLLSGNNATLELASVIQTRCGVNVSCLEPAIGIDTKNINPASMSAEFAISMGLAMRGAA
jgi:type IV pilus assembly protein PilM